MNQTKNCSKCKIEKELSEFNKDKRSKSGLQSVCKYCLKQYYEANKRHHAERCKQHYTNNKEYYIEYHKKYREDNQEKIRQYRADNKQYYAEYNKQWNEDNKDTRIEYMKQHRQENKEHYVKYYEDNKDVYAERGKQWREDNKEYLAEWSKKYQQTPEGKASIKASAHNRRAHKLNNGGKHTAKEILALFDLQSGKCVYCKVKLYKTGNGIFHSDHIVPLSKGGTNSIENIQLLCAKCNQSKSNKLPEIFAAKFNKLF